MWNAPLANGIALSVATGSALFLYGLSLGLLVAGICWVFIASSDQQTSPSQESYPSISDEEIEILTELVREAVARSGWTLCGDCYTRILLHRMQQPESAWARPAGASLAPTPPLPQTPARWRTPPPLAEKYAHPVGARRS